MTILKVVILAIERFLYMCAMFSLILAGLALAAYILSESTFFLIFTSIIITVFVDIRGEGRYEASQY